MKKSAWGLYDVYVSRSDGKPLFRNGWYEEKINKIPLQLECAESVLNVYLYRYPNYKGRLKLVGHDYNFSDYRYWKFHFYD